MKKKHSKYRKIWLLWVALEGLVATFAIMNSFLLLRYLYLSRGTAIPEASVVLPDLCSPLCTCRF